MDFVVFLKVLQVENDPLALQPSLVLEHTTLQLFLLSPGPVLVDFT